jgi:hypothetical protein
MKRLLLNFVTIASLLLLLGLVPLWIDSYRATDGFDLVYLGRCYSSQTLPGVISCGCSWNALDYLGKEVIPEFDASRSPYGVIEPTPPEIR